MASKKKPGIDLLGPGGNVAEQLAAAQAESEANEKRAAELAELKKLYGDLAEAVDKARQRNKALNESMKDGRYEAQAKEMARLNREYREQSREAAKVARAAREANATPAQKARAAEVERLTKTYGANAGAVEKAAQANKALERSIGNGTYSRSARELERLNREATKMRREAELTDRYGRRVGGFLARNERVLAPLATAATVAGGAALATGAGLTRQGFSGTVESAQFNNEWKMLSREMAGAFKPVIDVTTRMTRSLRKFMEGLTPTGQNAVMVGGLAASAYGTAKFIGAGGVSGIAARALGLSVGASAAATAVGSAGGSAAGSAMGKTAAGGAAGAGAASSGLAIAGPLAALAALVNSGYRTHQDAQSHGGGTTADYFRAGGERFTGRFSEFGIDPKRWAFRQVGLEKTWDEKSNKFYGMFGGTQKFGFDEPDANAKRRQVSISGGGFQEGGAGYDALQAAISRVEAPRDSDDNGEMTSLMRELVKLAQQAAADRGRSIAPPLVRPGA